MKVRMLVKIEVEVDNFKQLGAFIDGVEEVTRMTMPEVTDIWVSDLWRWHEPKTEEVVEKPMPKMSLEFQRNRDEEIRRIELEVQQERARAVEAERQRSKAPTTLLGAMKQRQDDEDPTVEARGDKYKPYPEDPTLPEVIHGRG